MPELPEVEVIRRGLSRVLPGRKIVLFQVLETRSYPDFDDDTKQWLLRARVVDVNRRGKLLLIGLNASYGQQPERTLLVHLRMTGQLVYRSAEAEADLDASGGFGSASMIGQLPDKSTRIVIAFDDGSYLYFNDQRKFGYMKLVTAEQLAQDSFYRGLGPEPLAEGFDWRQLRRALSGEGRQVSKTSVKAALLDQNKVAGIGNIYADESLFKARIDPRRSVDSLSVAEYKRLLAAIRECLTLSIDAGGSTARNYVDALGFRGEYLDLHAQVYNRSGQPCVRCKHEITKIRVAGRGTHICPKCQR